MRERESDTPHWPALVREVRALRERVGRLERRSAGGRASHPRPAIEGKMERGEARARRLAVLEEVAKAGGLVGADRFREIGRHLGYNPRGLGGFFVGDATLRRVGDTVQVTDRGFQILQARIYEELRERPHRLPPMKPLFKIEGKSLTQTLLEMREEEYR